MPRILVVDDSPTILKVVSAILARSGLEATTARDGIAGLRLLADDGPFDLILLDFVMPRMNGYQFCRELRKNATLKALPVVLMSAKGDRIRAQFVQQTGALDAITKPFDARTLVAVIEGVLAKVKAGKGAAPPPADTMADEESLGEDSEPRPSVLPRQLEMRAVGQIIQHVNAVVVPAILDLMKDPDRTKPDVLQRAIGRALEDSPLDALLHTLREATSATTREVLSGDLAFVPIPEVLQVLQMQRQTGVMRAVSGKRSLNLFMRDGLLDLATWTGEDAHFRLGRYFVEMGRLKRAEVESAVESAMRKNARLGDYVVETGKVSDDTRREALSRQSAEIVYDMVRWPHGRFWFTRDPHSAEAESAKLGLAIAPLVLEGFRRVDEWRVMEKTIVWDEILVVDEAALRQVGMALTNAERLVLNAVDGKRNVNEIANDCDVARFDAVRVLYQFLSSRVLRPIQAPLASEATMRPSQMPPGMRPVEEFSTTEGSLEP